MSKNEYNFFCHRQPLFENQSELDILPSGCSTPVVMKKLNVLGRHYLSDPGATKSCTELKSELFFWSTSYRNQNKNSTIHFQEIWEEEVRAGVKRWPVRQGKIYLDVGPHIWVNLEWIISIVKRVERVMWSLVVILIVQYVPVIFFNCDERNVNRITILAQHYIFKRSVGQMLFDNVCRITCVL